MGIRLDFLKGNVIDVALWVAAADAGRIVGTCDRKGCGSALKVLPATGGSPYEIVAGTPWFSAECSKGSHEVTWPGGRVKRPVAVLPTAGRRPGAQAMAGARAHLHRVSSVEHAAFDQRRLGERAEA